MRPVGRRRLCDLGFDIGVPKALPLILGAFEAKRVAAVDVSGSLTEVRAALGAVGPPLGATPSDPSPIG